MKMKSFYGVGYMFLVTAVFSSILIGISRGTRQRVENNEKLAFEKAVLNAFAEELNYASDTEAHTLFEEHFQKPFEEADWYRYEKDGQLKGYAVLIGGKGFWAPIQGIVGIEPDGKTLAGIAFYEQNETPGLGARITEPEFQKQFDGVTLQSQGAPLTMRPEGQTLSEGQVHAITGATQTCMRLELFMNEDLQNWMQAMSSTQGSQP